MRKTKNDGFSKENFLPIVIGLLLTGLVLLLVNFKAAFDATRIEIITIEETPLSQDDLSVDEDEAGTMEIAPQLSWDEQVDPLFIEARRQADKGRLHEAQRAYEAIFGQSLSSRALNDLAVLHYREGEKEKALDYINLAIRTGPVYGRSFFNRGLVLSELGLFAEAIKSYQKSIDQMPHHFESHYNMALAYIRLDQSQLALETFLGAADIGAGEHKALALYNAGTLSSRLNLPEQARRYFEQAIRYRPDFLKPRYALVALEPGTPEGRRRALEQYETIIKLKPSYAPTYFNLGRFHSDRNETGAAEAAYRKAIHFYPEYAKAHYNLGLVLLEQKHLSEAQEQFNWLLGRNPRHPAAIFNLGRIAFAQQNYQEALLAYQKAIDARRGRYPEAFFNMGLVYAAQGKDNEAAKAYRSALRYKKNWPEAYYNLGLAYLRQGKKNNAERAFMNALSDNPRYEQAWFNLGVLYSRLENDEKAIGAFRKALEIRPDYPRASLNLAVRYAQMGQHSKAIAEYVALLAKHDNYSLAWFNLGLAYFKTGQLPAAEQAFTRVLALESDNVRALELQGRVLAARGNYGEAVQFLQRALSAEAGDADLRLELARVYRETGQSNLARRELERALRLEPENARVKKELASLDAEPQ